MPPVTVQQAFELALQHHQAGRLMEAETLYRQILAVQPQHADSLHLLGALAQQTGRPEVAIDLMSQAIALAPDHAAAHSNLASVYLAQRRWEEARAQSHRAVGLAPELADAHYHLGAALAALGRREEALASYRRALQIKPEHALAENNLGNVLRELNRLDEAIASYRRAIQCQPSNADAYNNLGAVLAETGQVEEAIASYHRALQINPAVGAVYQNLGNALQGGGRYEEAINAYRRALELDARLVEVHYSLGNALINQRRFEEATVAFRHMIRDAPADHRGWTSLGYVSEQLGRADEALASYRRALELQPGDARGHCRVGRILQRQSRLEEAAAAYARALELLPDHTEALYRLAALYKEQGRQEEAETAVRRLLEIAPDVPRIHSDLILLLQISPNRNQAAVDAEGRRWDEKFGGAARRATAPFLHDRDPERRLRIGYVSPDFRDHVVGRNVLPLFRHHDRARHEIICYSGVMQRDDMTEAFRQHADRWREAAGLGDESLADLIRRDEVDILVDLSLHTAGNRLPMFALQPAPVQVSFAGYPGSTGLEAIVYRLSDRYLEGEDGAEEGGGREGSYLLDSFWCYDPCGVDLEVNALPARSNGFVTFASLNDFSKISAAILKLWARILAEAKDSRLMMLTVQGSHRQRTAEMLMRVGIEPQRIEFFDPSPRREYLSLYHRADIMLDPFPYNGHTTSLDALWMGVPVVTLTGERTVSRAGRSQLSNLGLRELVAFSEDDYVGIAAQLARDLPRLTELRGTLRPRMEASVLMDEPRFARQIEDAYRAMWRRWCLENAVP